MCQSAFTFLEINKIQTLMKEMKFVFAVLLYQAAHLINITQAFTSDFHQSLTLRSNIIGQEGYHPLRYREHEDKDSDTTLIKLVSRTPSFGYNVKKEISQRKKQAGGMNQGLVKALLLNQVFTLGVGTLITALTIGVEKMAQLSHWADSSGLGIYSDVNPVVLGVLGALPSIVIGSLVENSDKREFANTNFSTIIMVLTLFGRRNAPPDELRPPQLRGKPFPTSKTLDVMTISTILATATAIAEETIFRANVPGVIAYYNHNNVALALFGQAVLFGLGHVSPKSNMVENGIVVGFQAINGICFGLLYILSGGNLLACIIAHAVYDFQVLLMTWVTTNAQIEYAEVRYLEPLESDLRKELTAFGHENLLGECKRLFYTFDFDKNRSLSLGEVRKGMAYLWMEKGSPAPATRDIDELFQTFAHGKSRMSLPEFAQLFMALENKIK